MSKEDRLDSVVFKRDTGWTVMLLGFDDDPDGFFAWLQTCRGWTLTGPQIHTPTMDRFCDARFGSVEASANWDDMAGAVVFVRSFDFSPAQILESLFGEFDPERHKVVIE